MANYKSSINKHLSSARNWLNRAQSSFEKEKDVRGELDLFLVQAELKHAQKLNRDHQPKYKYSVLKHGAALITALFILVFGISTSYFYLNNTLDNKSLGSNDIIYHSNQDFLATEYSQLSQDNLNNIQLSSDAVFLNNKNSYGVSVLSDGLLPSNKQKNEKINALQQGVDDVIVMGNVQKSQSSLPEKTITNSSETKNSNLVSKEEFKSLIRSAGESLRGQN
ncbi:hypothetical protein LJC10_01940 [Selenomonadales bacterium OttesenSCG-928-I06]|nr:hypothetical protein [Selenomonadales bacterium OttesenSCG-928-I06]